MNARNASSPAEVANMNTSGLRENFLIENVFEKDIINLTLSFYDRFIVGGAMPVNESITLSNPDNLKAKYLFGTKGDGNHKCRRKRHCGS